MEELVARIREALDVEERRLDALDDPQQAPKAVFYRPDYERGKQIVHVEPYGGEKAYRRVWIYNLDGPDWTWAVPDDAVELHSEERTAAGRRMVTADRKILAWHPIETRTVNETTEYTCPCLWDPYLERASWHPEVLCELTGIIASRYGLELTPCVCRDCTPKSQWAERGYGIEEK